MPTLINDDDDHDNDDGDGDSVIIDEHDILHPFRPPPISKRQKVRHGDSRELPLLVKSDSPEESSQVTNNAGTRAILLFDGQRDGRVKLSFVGSSSTPDAVLSRSNPRPPKPGKRAPFFTHSKHHIMMYCGPGHEKFPIAFRKDNQDHEKVRNDWLIKNSRKRMARARALTMDPYLDGELVSDSSDDEVNSTDVRTWPAPDLDEDVLLSQVLEIFPDIQHAFARTKICSMYETYRKAGMTDGPGPNTAEIVEEILAASDYPKETKESQKESQPFEAETDRTIQWNRDNHKDSAYPKDAVVVLANEFSSVPTRFISETVAKKKTIFDSYLFLQDTDDNFFSRPKKLYKRLKQPRTQIEKKYQRELRRESTQYADMIDELMAAKQQAERERLRRRNEAKEAEDEATNLAIHKLQGQIVECQCCFDGEIPLNRAVHCQGEAFHWICFDCVRGLADSQIGSMKHQMLCVEPGKCQEKLSLDGLAQALSVRTLDRLALNEQQAAIVAAQIEGLEQCPHCDFKAIVDPIEVDTIFSCQNPDCFKVTCRKCKEPSHLPKTCEEVKKDRGLSARHMVEEARSSAMMRECPRCKTKLIKEAGCNKMSCSCGCYFCYVCNGDLSSLRDGYEHFNARKAKCPLYDGPDGVERHDQDANEAEEEAIKRARTDYEDVAAEELRIETGKSKIAGVGRANDGNGILNLQRLHDQMRQNLRNDRQRMEGHMRDRQQLRAFDVPPPVHIQRGRAPILPQLPIQPQLPQLPHLPQPPVARPIIPLPCPDLWPPDQDMGMGFEQARRIHDFRTDTARRRDSINHRQNGASAVQPGQPDQHRAHPDPIRRQPDPEVGRVQFAPLDYIKGRRDAERDHRGRCRRSLQHLRREFDPPFEVFQPQNNVAQDNPPGEVDPRVWNTLDPKERFLDGLRLEPFRERDRNRREKERVAGAGLWVRRTQGGPSIEGQQDDFGGDDDINMEDLVHGRGNRMGEYPDVGSSSRHERQAQRADAANELDSIGGDWWAPEQPNRDTPTRRATMPLLTQNALRDLNELYFQEDAVRNQPGRAANWAV